MECCIDFSMIDLVVNEHFVAEKTTETMRFEGRTAPKPAVIGDTIGSVEIDLYLPTTFAIRDAKTLEL